MQSSTGTGFAAPGETQQIDGLITKRCLREGVCSVLEIDILVIVIKSFCVVELHEKTISPSLLDQVEVDLGWYCGNFLELYNSGNPQRFN